MRSKWTLVWEEFVSVAGQTSISNVPQERQDNGVIAPKCYDPGVVLTVEGDGSQWLSCEFVITKG